MRSYSTGCTFTMSKCMALLWNPGLVPTETVQSCSLLKAVLLC